MNETYEVEGFNVKRWQKQKTFFFLHKHTIFKLENNFSCALKFKETKSCAKMKLHLNKIGPLCAKGQYCVNAITG